MKKCDCIVCRDNVFNITEEKMAELHKRMERIFIMFDQERDKYENGDNCPFNLTTLFWGAYVAIVAIDDVMAGDMNAFLEVIIERYYTEKFIALDKLTLKNN